MSPTNFCYKPLYSLSDFDRLFDETLNASNEPSRTQNGGQLPRQNSSLSAPRPKMDAHEDKEEKSSVLTVPGVTKVDETKEQDGYTVRERRFGKISRSIPVPQGIKEDVIKASLENGVLSVSFPRTAPEAQPKKISVV
ncbi:unnamed protein product [Peniophora sp. CBMAI 1063]|nr:unnamed protein product [Peniophora sp. CBMAI 1063]